MARFQAASRILKNGENDDPLPVTPYPPCIRIMKIASKGLAQPGFAHVSHGGCPGDGLSGWVGNGGNVPHVAYGWYLTADWRPCGRAIRLACRRTLGAQAACWPHYGRAWRAGRAQSGAPAAGYQPPVATLPVEGATGDSANYETEMPVVFPQGAYPCSVGRPGRNEYDENE